MHEYPGLLVDRTAGVCTVTLSRPRQHNALSLELCLSLTRCFDDLRFDSDLKVVVIRGKGPTFCAGVDTKELLAANLAWGVERRNRGLDAYMAVDRCSAAVIAVIEGPAIGGGCELVACADFAIATPAATLQWPEALKGGVGATQRLPRLVGSAKARELLFTARRIDAAEAHRIGFVSSVVPASDLEDQLAKTLQEIVRCNPMAIRLIKRAMQAGEACDRWTAIDIERQAIELNMNQARPSL